MFAADPRMPEPFDPYRKWLGIPPAEQPPDHYRLLGIGRFEDDPDTISNAADRQMAHVRTFQTGPRSAISQRLLNEISTARVCLLNPVKKAEYDGRLQAQIAATKRAAERPPVQQSPPVAPGSFSHAAAPSRQPMPTGGGPAPPLATQVGRSSYPRRNRKSPALAMAVVAVALLAAVAVLMMLRGNVPHTQPLAERPKLGTRPKRTETIERALPQSTGAPDSTSPPGSDGNAPSGSGRPPKLEIVKAEWGEGDRWEDITRRVRSLVFDERLVATAWGSFFLGVPDPAFGVPKRVRIAYIAAGESHDAEFADGDFIYLDGRPRGASQPTAAGLEVAAAIYGAGTTWIDVLPRLRRWVHDDRLCVRVEVVAQTDPAPGQRKALVLRYRTPEGEFVAHAWDSETLAIDARTIATTGKPIDLIALADPERDSTGGRWSKQAGTIVGPDSEPGNLTIRAALLDEYLLTAVIEAAARPDNVGITVPIGDRQAQVALDGWSGAICALQNIDGAMGHQNPTTRPGAVFELGQATTVRCAVRKSSIFVTCNGRVAVDWEGDPASLSAPPEAQAADGPAIVMRSLGKSWRITRLDAAALGQQSPPAVVPTPGRVVDLLKLIDPTLDAVAGDWQLDEEGLVSPVSADARLAVPYSPPDDYELRVRAARISGSDSLSIGLLVDGRQTSVALDRFDGSSSGLQRIDGENTDRNGTARPGRLFSDGRPAEVVCTVHPNSVRATCEDRLLVDWHGAAKRLSLEPHLTMPDGFGLPISAWNSQYRISKFELRPLPPEPPTEFADLSQPVDVLKQIDVARDAVYGDWRKEGDVLIAPGAPWARLQLPVIPPDDYTLTIEALGTRDIDFGIVVGGIAVGREAKSAVVRRRQADVVIGGGDRGEISGMQYVDGRFCRDGNPTTSEGKVIRDDGPNTIVCTVRKNRVEVVCNGKPVFSWEGEPRSLSLPHELIMPDDRRLFLRCWEFPYRITRLELSKPE